MLLQTRADFSTPNGNRIILQDFKNKNSTVISPADSTYPQGSCQARGFSDFSNRASCSAAPGQAAAELGSW